MSTKGHGAIRYVGTNAERIALETSGLVAGVMWIETDTLFIYRWDGTAWQTDGGGGPYLRLNATNDPVTAGLEIDAATADEPVLILQTTDDNATNPFVEMQKADNTVLHSIGQSTISFKPAADSVTFFQILDADGGVPILNVDATNERLGIGVAAPLAKLEVQGTAPATKVLIVQGAAAQTAYLQEWQISDGTPIQWVGQNGGLAIAPAVTASVGIYVLGGNPAAVQAIIRGAAAQTANLFETQSPGGVIATYIDANGDLIVEPTANSIATFQVNQSDSTNVLTVDTASRLVGIGKAPVATLDVEGIAGKDIQAWYTSGNAKIQWVGQHGGLAVAPTVAAGVGIYVLGGNPAAIQATIIGAAAQTASLLELRESDNSVFLSSGDGLGGSVFSGNVQLEDIDFVWAGDTEANLLRVDAGADEVRMGDWDTNYSAFEVDGTLRFEGTAAVWDDLYYPMSSGKIGGVNQPTWAAFQGNTFEYSFAINDYIHLPSGEIIHKYLEGSDIKLHVHIVLDGSDVGDTYVNYEIEYTIGDVGEVMAGAAIVTSGDTLITGGTADRTHIYIEIGTIAGAGYKITAALKMRFRRIALVGGGLNAPSNDPFVLMVGAHIEMDTVGSRTENAK